MNNNKALSTNSAIRAIRIMTVTNNRHENAEQRSSHATHDENELVRSTTARIKMNVVILVTTVEFSAGSGTPVEIIISAPYEDFR